MKNRYALVLLLGFVGALFITQKNLNPDGSFILWFVYIVICGLIISPPEKRKDLHLFLVGLGSGLILVLTLLYRWLFDGVPPHISGKIHEPERLVNILAALIPATALGIYLASIASDLIFSGLKYIINEDTKKLIKVESNIKAVLAILIALTAVLAFLSGDNSSNSTLENIQNALKKSE